MEDGGAVSRTERAALEHVGALPGLQTFDGPGAWCAGDESVDVEAKVGGGRSELRRGGGGTSRQRHEQGKRTHEESPLTLRSYAVRSLRPHGKGRILLTLEPEGEAVVSADLATAFRGWLDR